MAPIWEGATVMPAYSRLVPGASAFLQTPRSTIPRPTPGRSSRRSWTWLDDGHDDSSVMFARAYNGRYGDVAVRLGPSDLAHLQEKVNRFNDEAGVGGAVQRLRSADVERDLRRLRAARGRVRRAPGERFRNRTGVVAARARVDAARAAARSSGR